MPRMRGVLAADVRPENVRGMSLELLIGGPTDYTLEQLRIGWQILGDELTRQAIEGATEHHATPHRPWGWWQFERAEQRPRRTEGDGWRDDEAELARLAELGELTHAEIERLRLTAADSRPLIGTDAERWYWSSPPRQDSVERRDVRLYEIAREATA
jgi:hypothetical protein